MPGIPIVENTPPRRGKPAILTPKRRKSLLESPEAEPWENDDAAEKKAIREKAKEARRQSIGDLKYSACCTCRLL